MIYEILSMRQHVTTQRMVLMSSSSGVQLVSTLQFQTRVTPAGFRRLGATTSKRENVITASEAGRRDWLLGKTQETR